MGRIFSDINMGASSLKDRGPNQMAGHPIQTGLHHQEDLMEEDLEVLKDPQQLLLFLMNNQLYQLPVQMSMQEDVNVETLLKGSKPIPFGWEMSNVVLQSFIPLPGHLRFSQLFYHLIVMPKISSK